MYTDEDQQKPDGDVHLSKVDKASFKDEWDDVIENYTVGSRIDPDMIDSASQVAQNLFLLKNLRARSMRKKQKRSQIQRYQK